MAAGNAIQSAGPVSATRIGGVAVSGTAAAGYEIVASGPAAAAWSPGMALQAATPAAGVALVNGTPDIISWTTPNDGLLHRILILGILNVTSPETGGQVTIRYNLGDGTAIQHTFFAAGQGAGDVFPANNYALPVNANSIIKIAQGTALTAGAATMWAEIWGS